MKIVLTGNMGYVGPVLVNHLRERYPDADLVGYDLGLFAHSLCTGERLPERRLDVQYFGDIRDPDPAVFAGADAVVHLAAVSNDPIGNKFEEPTHQINHRSTVAVAKLAKEAGASNFVLASSCSVYGSAEEGARNEDSELNPLTAYAKSKVQAEEDLAGVADDSFAVSCLRFATACGASPRLRLDLVLNDFVASAHLNKEILVLSDGSPWRPLIDVQDMALAIEWGCIRDNGNGGPHVVVNAGSNDWNYRIGDLAHAVAAEIPGTDVKINPEGEPDKRSYQVNFDRFAELAPDFVPRQTLADTVQEVYTLCQRLDDLPVEFRQSRYIRLYTLSKLIELGELGSGLSWQQ